MHPRAHGLALLLLVLSAPFATAAPVSKGVTLGNQTATLGSPRTVASEPDGEVISMAYAPSGKEIVYITRTPGEGIAFANRAPIGPWALKVVSLGRNPQPQTLAVLGMGSVDTHLYWSPDGRWIVAGTISAEGEQGLILVARAGGAARPIAKGFVQQGCWDALSTRFAFQMTYADSEERGVTVYDLRSGKTTLLRNPVSMAQLRWSPDGTALEYVRRDGENGRTVLKQYRLDARTGIAAPIGVQLEIEHVAPGGTRWIDMAGEFQVMSRNARPRPLSVPFGETECLGWSHDGKLVLFQQSVELRDRQGRRAGAVHPIWFANGAEAVKRDAAMVLSHAQNGPAPVWCPKRLEIAYLDGDDLRVAPVQLRPLSATEKMAENRPLTPEEQKVVATIAMSNLKQLGTALAMYSQDYDEVFPDGNNLVQTLMPYLKNPELFNLPGTQTHGFEYTPLGSLASIESPADTILGKMRVPGYEVRLYADGHVKMHPAR